MTPTYQFDYIIIGHGLAGFQLALKLSSDSFFDAKQIALIDPSKKNTNDKTWSFWETEPSQWDAVTYKSWHKATVITSKKSIALELSPYRYKTIKAIDFYTEAKTKLKQKKNIHFIPERVISLIENEQVSVKTEQNTYTCYHVFDSRLPKAFSMASKKYVHLIQHFKGWIIKSETDVFDETQIVMMDYRLKDGEQTTFTYVLPFSKKEALIEFTYFTNTVVDESVYDHYITTYINHYLHLKDYTIIETEKGAIPMTNFPFHKWNTKQITKIGTGGGWVKGSSGYSFKHTEKKTSLIIDNLKANRTPSHRLFQRKYKFYDKVFLKVLKDENHKGEWIFQQFYDKNTSQTMFRFLDEESTFYEELKIMASLFSWSFIKAFFKTL
ncbi:lycopene cyclase family protein [Mariniflexile ostreae]|uniref:Lycopene cyclase family protein n=1 Tax=Mariniflexile ostreae TaxID=1520892 RepID=A0ABV5FEW7_9FLAO